MVLGSHVPSPPHPNPHCDGDLHMLGVHSDRAVQLVRMLGPVGME